MRLFGFLPVMARRTVVALGVAGMTLTMAPAAYAQDAAAAQQPVDMLKFGASVPGPVLLMIQINPGQETAFEEAYAAIRAGLAASDKPELQAQARTMNLLRLNAEIPPTQPRPYVVILDPPTPDVSYGFTEMLYYSGAWKVDDVEVRKTVDAIFEKVKASVFQTGVWNMIKK